MKSDPLKYSLHEHHLILMSFLPKYTTFIKRPTNSQEIRSNKVLSNTFSWLSSVSLSFYRGNWFA